MDDAAERVRSGSPRGGRTDVVRRVVSAPAELVYRAFTTREAIEAWLPPDGMTGRLERFDPRMGGGYRLALRYVRPPVGGAKSSADTDVVEARFVELMPGVRIVQEVDFDSEDERYAGTMRLTWSVREVEEGSEVEFRAEHVPVGIAAADHEVGMNSSLDHLEDYLASARP